jgi:hypothetical protein
MRRIVFFIFTLLLCFPVQAQGKDLASKVLKGEPSFAQIMDAYLCAEGIENKNLPDWERKIKKSAYFPTLYLGYDRSFDSSQSLSNTDNISISDGTVTIGPEENDYDVDEDSGHTVRVRAVWRLSDIVFNNANFALARERRELAKLHSDLGQKIYQIYEERHLYLMKYRQSKASEPQKALIFYSKYLLLTQKLDALTEGRFAKSWWKKEKE